MESTRVPNSWERLIEVSFARNYHLVVAALIYIPFIFLGYGEQPDSYLVVRTGRRLISSGEYFPSRRPGSVAYEFPQALLDRIGGSFLSNLGTLIMSLVFLAAFTQILKRLRIPNREYLIWGVILLPMYWNNSTVTLDYIWAMALSTTGFLAALRRNYFQAALLCGLALGARLPTIITLAGLFAYLWLERPLDRKNITLCAFLSFLVGALCFVPPFASAHWTLGFLNVDVNRGDPALWTPYLQAGRFVYKNIYVWGLFGTICILASLFFLRKSLPHFASKPWRNISIAAFAIVIGYEAFFLRYPFKIEYLLPMVPFVMILLGIGLQTHRMALAAILIAVASYNVISVNIAYPDLRWRARSASFGVSVERGLLLQNLRERLMYRKCEEIECVGRANAALLRRIRQRDGDNVLY